MPELEQTNEAFREAVIGLLNGMPQYRKRSGAINLAAFASEFEDRIHYESFRKVMAGDRQPSRHLMEIVAFALQIEPSYFCEYRKLEVQRTLGDLNGQMVDELLDWLRSRGEGAGARA